jgi:anti-sigma regulatory factor (Ser/Thr protein kinase)
MTTTTRTFLMNEAPRAKMRLLLEEAAAGAGLPTGTLDDLLLAVWEACVQATSHSGEPEVDVTVRAEKHSVEIEVRNAGIYRPEAPTTEYGADQRLGVALTMAMEMSLVDEIHVDPGTEEDPRTLIRMVKLTGG